MKKLFVLTFVFWMLILTSCSSGGLEMSLFSGSENQLKNPLSGNDRSIANTQFEQILNACKTQDKNALKVLFSEKVINENPNIDKSIDELLDFFQGDVVSYNDWGGSGAYAGKNDDGSGRNWKKLYSTYDLKTNKQTYRFAMEVVVVDTASPENIGISSLYIIKAEDSDMSFAYRGDGKWTPGINIIN